MNDGGTTKRLSISTSFLWIMMAIALLVLLSLGVLSYMVSTLLVDYKTLKNDYEFMSIYYESRDYNRAIEKAPEDAKLILERLDMAVLSADEVENKDPSLPKAVETPGNTPGTNSGKEGNTNGTNPNDLTATEGAKENIQNGTNVSNQSFENQGEEDIAQTAENDPNNAMDNSESEANNMGGTLAEDEAWETFHSRLSLPKNAPTLEIDEFRFSPRGAYSFFLKQDANPGMRLKGRALTVFAIEDKEGEVILVSDPSIDLTKPSQGYERGGRYNIISSKMYRGNISVPQGSKVLSAEVLAWDEETKKLVFLKKISLEGL
jgi:hypothetical protein